VQIVAGDPVGSILAEVWRSGGTEGPEGAPYKVEGIGQDKIPGTLDLSGDRRVHHGERSRRLRDGAAAHARGGAVRRRLGGAHRACGAERGASLNDPDAFVVTFLCDTGERYLSKLYNDEWMRENQLLDPER
jgi:cystathionine beta-synthase